MFYVQGHSNENKRYIMKTVPRDLFNMGDQSNITPQEGYHNDPFDDIKYLYVLSNDNELNWVMEDIPTTIVEKPSHVTKESEDKDDYDLDDILLNFMNLITLEHIGRMIQIFSK